MSAPPTTIAATLPRELQWLFGDLFLRRLEFERNHPDQVLWSQTIRKLYTRPNMANYWDALIREYRNCLLNAHDAPRKFADELQVDSRDFDSAFWDCYAEIGAVPQLHKLGFDSFEVLLRPGGPNSSKTADLKAKRHGEPAALEIKNLRAHECVETYLVKVFEDFRLKGQDMSGLRLVVQTSFRATLEEPEKQSLRKIVQTIRNYPRNENLTEQLSERAVARFRIEDGPGNAFCRDGIILDELIGSISDFDGLFRKIVSDLQKAMQQLHSPAVSDAKVRAAVMRWDIPWFNMTVPGHLQQVAGEILRPALAELSNPIDLHVFSDYDWDLFTTLDVI
jgi:hypothetical protein